MFPRPPLCRRVNLSVLSLMVGATDPDSHWVLFICCLCLSYLCYVTFRSLFSTRISWYQLYRPRWHHNSVPESAATLVTYMLGLINPICYNFTLLLGPRADWQPGAPQQLAYFSVYRQMERVPVLGSAYVYWFPWLLLFGVLCVLGNVPSIVGAWLRGEEPLGEALRHYRTTSAMRARRAAARDQGAGPGRGMRPVRA